MAENTETAVCTLEVGDRILARSHGGPFEVEYALFEARDIQLHAIAPGAIRELGYLTTAGKALDRLARAGVYRGQAEEAAALVRPVASVYARGPNVRRVVHLLGAHELFEGGEYDAVLRRYTGTWLNLVTLATDIPLARARAALQVLHIVSALSEVDGSTEVFLRTGDYTRERKAGERTLRRVPLDLVSELPEALSAFASVQLARGLVREGPTFDALDVRVTSRLATCVRGDVQLQLERLHKGLTMPPPPGAGPLSHPPLWDLEVQLDRGDITDIVARLDAIERVRGPGIGATYLRAYASLLLRREEPVALAQRVSKLAAAAPGFHELTLLAARAWLATGDEARASLCAEELLQNPQVAEGVRLRALELVDVLVKPAARTPSNRPPPLSSPPPPVVARSDAPKRSSRPPLPAAPVASTSAPAAMRERPRSDPPATLRERPRSDPPATLRDASSAPSPPRSQRDADATPIPSAPGAVHDVSFPRPPRMPMLDVVVSHLDENEPPPLSFADSPLSVRPGRATVPEVASEPPPSARTLDARDRAKEPPRSRASASPLRKVSVNFRAPTQRGEKAEELSLPEGRESDRPRPFDDLPKTVLGARIGFTHMSRELGRLYRTRRNVVLYADMGGVADMQEYLDQRFFRPRSLKREEQVEIWMHGAFLSEILARMLGGFWLDIAPSEIGYWEMRLPSNVRAWPFGRVMRFVMQADEGRTLTDYVEALRLCTEV